MLKSTLGILFTIFGMFSIMVLWPVNKSERVEQQIKERVVKIQVSNGTWIGQGTGTLLGHNHILTNAHLFPDKLKEKPQVYFRRFNDSDFIEAVLVSSNTKVDFAILKFNGKDYTTTLPITSKWKLGEAVTILGNPEAGDFILDHSRILAYSYLPNPMHYTRPMIIFQCNAGGPGFSGSGVYNTGGEYVGTFELGEVRTIVDDVLDHFGIVKIRPRFCMAIPAKEIIERNLDRPWLGFNLSEDVK